MYTGNLRLLLHETLSLHGLLLLLLLSLFSLKT
jgi:hypothetical protein